jgi:uncharacterized protein involved in exopolysaccharide biosynthesis
MMTGPSRESNLFDDEIDLLQYLRILLDHWHWIVLTTLVAAAVAAGISQFILAPTYEATALVTITSPKYLMEFSPEFRAVAQERLETEISKTYPELAKSDELLEQVAGVLDQESNGQGAVSKGRMSVQASKNVGIIRLTVQDEKPTLATTIVNIWAEHYVRMLNQLYGGEEGEYSFFAEQLALAGTDLETAQEALAEFKARDRAQLVSSELDAKIAALDGYLATGNTIAVLEQEIDGWRAQLATRPGDQDVSPADELTAFLMQMEAFGVFREDAQPQFQILLEKVARGQTIAEQIAFLDQLESLLQTRAAEIAIQVEELEPNILSLQYELQQARNEQDRLNRDVNIARSLYESLSLKTEEARIASESLQGVSRLASRASIPDNPVGPRKLVNTATGAGLGLAAGLLLAVLLELLSKTRSTAETDSPADES